MPGFFDGVGPSRLEGAERVGGSGRVVDPHRETQPGGDKEAARQCRVGAGVGADVETGVEGSGWGTSAGVVNVSKKGLHVGT